MRNSIGLFALLLILSFGNRAVHIEFIPEYDPEIVQGAHLRVSFKGVFHPAGASDEGAKERDAAAAAQADTMPLGEATSITWKVLGRPGALYVVRDWFKESTSAAKLRQNWEQRLSKGRAALAQLANVPPVAASGARRRSNSQTHLQGKALSNGAAAAQSAPLLPKPSTIAMLVEEQLVAWERKTGANRHHILTEDRFTHLQRHLLKYKGDSEEGFIKQAQTELSHIMHNHFPYKMIVDALKQALYAYYSVNSDKWTPEDLTPEMRESVVVHELQAYFSKQAQSPAEETEERKELSVLHNPHSIRAQRYFSYFLYEVQKAYPDEPQRAWALRNLRDHITSGDWWHRTFPFLPLLYDAPHIVPECWEQLVQTGKLIPRGYALFKLPAEERKALSSEQLRQLTQFEERYQRPLAVLTHTAFRHLSHAKLSSHWSGGSSEPFTLPLLHRPILVQLTPIVGDGDGALASISIEVEKISGYIHRPKSLDGGGYIIDQGGPSPSEGAGKKPPLLQWNIPAGALKAGATCGSLVSIHITFDGRKFSLECRSSS